jgi:tRNA A37 threonylcarbamoyladenosine synthetase subunit TsaC/SUA5/YrdC
MHTDERRGFVVTRTGCERESVGQTRTPCKEKRIAPFRLGNVGAIMDDKRVEWNGDKEQKAIDVLSGVPSELIARELWNEYGKVAFASSANPSGKGNCGRVEGIGERIYNEADLVPTPQDLGAL